MGRAKGLASCLPCSVERENKWVKRDLKSPLRHGADQVSFIVPLCSPPNSHPGPGEPPVVVCSWLALSKLCWKQLFGHQLCLCGHFYQCNFPDRCDSFFSSRQNGAGSAFLPLVGPGLEVDYFIQTILLTLKNIK